MSTLEKRHADIAARLAKVYVGNIVWILVFESPILRDRLLFDNLGYHVFRYLVLVFGERVETAKRVADGNRTLVAVVDASRDVDRNTFCPRKMRSLPPSSDDLTSISTGILSPFAIACSLAWRTGETGSSTT